jgi:hypothetical protein
MEGKLTKKELLDLLRAEEEAPKKKHKWSKEKVIGFLKRAKFEEDENVVVK